MEKELSTELKLPADEVLLMGVPEGMEGTLADRDEELTLQVTGLAENLETLETAEITASIDIDAYMEEHSLTELLAGEYEMELKLTLPDGVRQETKTTVQVILKDTDAENKEE